jgi:hypothetical protein
MEDIFNDNIKVIIDKKDATIIIKDYVSELETIISPGENEFFFFFTVDGVLYRLRIYKGGKYLTGDVRKRIGYQDYELVCLLKSMDQNSINELDGLNLSNLYFYEEYWKELKNVSSYKNGINYSK